MNVARKVRRYIHNDVAHEVRRYRDANTNSRRLHLPTVASELGSDVIASDVSSDATFNVVPDTSTSHTDGGALSRQNRAH